MIRKAKVVYGKPSDVTSYLVTRNQENIDNKMVIVDIEEDGILGIPVFNGLQINQQVQPGWIVWVYTDGNRYVMCGIYDNGITMTDTDMLKIDMPAGDALIKAGNNQIKWDNTAQSVKTNDTSLEVKV